ncbi:hypothetical protein BGZ94_003029 [Podila epigama]|nr:hypothetical protein BGZ94_003029 [Podila epigama]
MFEKAYYCDVKFVFPKPSPDRQRVNTSTGEVEPDELEPGELEPDELQPDKLQPDELESGELESGELQPGKLQPDELESGELESGELEPGELEPDELEPDELQPGEPSSEDKEQTLYAHKVVLTQWEYFRKMLTSKFMEGGSEPTRITIKDPSFATFKVLLLYMYTNHIPSTGSGDLKHVYDPCDNDSDVSWERVYFAADRYRLLRLREGAKKQLISSLDATNATAFLFRAAYLFPELRAAVIEYIVKNRDDTFTAKDTTDLYMDHPEFTNIQSEIINAVFKSVQLNK